MKGCRTGTGRPCHESPPAGKPCRRKDCKGGRSRICCRGGNAGIGISPNHAKEPTGLHCWLPFDLPHSYACRASMRQDGPGRARRGIKKFVGNRPPSLPSSVLKNAKRPPCGGPRILFPRPAGTGHGHRNYSALSALAGASVLASGRRVSSMMAMGALSPLRGMASFITRV